jgi:hypothetical protein
MPIKVKQADGSVLLVSLISKLATLQVSEKEPEKAPEELPMCKDCGERKVTGKGMMYCEPCK